MREFVDEDLLLAVLNSSPVVEGQRTEQLRGSEGRRLVEQFGGRGTEAELAHLQLVRDVLQAIIHGDEDAHAGLDSLLGGMALVPEAGPGGLEWQLRADDEQRLAARTVMAWSRAMSELPGRLRPCANTECNLYLVDHSRPGTARWCSMATCGNRMKARAYSQRVRNAQGASG